MRIWLVVAAIGLLCAIAYGADKEYECKVLANFALQLFKDKEKFPILNVMPKDQDMLDKVEAHKGTDLELWHRTYADCMGTRT
jgi:hypothetical protein